MKKIITNRFCKSKLHRFNKNPRSKQEDSMFLKSYFDILKTAIELNKKGQLTKTNMEMMFQWKKATARKILTDLEEGLHIYTNLEAEVYFKLQEILIEVNHGKPMRMDIFINVIISWFIYTYYNRTEYMTEGDPFFIPHKARIQKRLRKLKLISKFNNMFEKYYDTIIDI